ncbi:MAG: lyase family protein, partial [Bacteroidota bacterium]
MKLWQKSADALESVTRFTAGEDAKMDAFLIRHDLIGSMAHIIMLEKVGLLKPDELKRLLHELRAIHASALQGDFHIAAGVEDIHSQVEMELTRRLGDDGKKIHSGRSRNDQVLVDMKLFLRDELQSVVLQVRELFELLLTLSDRHREVLLPGYTH